MENEFQWVPQPAAEALLLAFQQKFTEASPFITRFESELERHTSSRLFDWIDHYVIDYSVKDEAELEGAGFVLALSAGHYRVFTHPRAQLPRVVMYDQAEVQPQGIAVGVEDLAEFLFQQRISTWIEGSPFSNYRRALMSEENGVVLWGIERRATMTMTPHYIDAAATVAYLEAKEKWQNRRRSSPFESDDALMLHALECVEEMVALVGRDMAAWIVLACERNYWQARNTAAQIQKNRQDRLGMGWGNHDHHTFRSSRTHFDKLVRLFEMLGFHCRERFFAGIEAGWGAQVMEHSGCALVLFLDVDLAPEELDIDFAHHSLPERNTLGTIGLWCALHGDSILGGGMHHLEAQFLFEALTEDLAHRGVGMMNPFSNFTYLKQAFTAGEIWEVEESRIARALERGHISPSEALKFRRYGAIGSHLENLQRRDGYKGFNQKNVSFIIKETDPRKDKNISMK